MLKRRIKLLRGGLVPHQSSGTWGNRGQGNEGESLLENGLSFLYNIGDHVDDGVTYGVNWLLGKNPNKAVQNSRLSREAGSGGSWTDVDGNLHTNPIMGIAPNVTIKGVPVKGIKPASTSTPKRVSLKKTLTKMGRETTEDRRMGVSKGARFKNKIEKNYQNPDGRVNNEGAGTKVHRALRLYAIEQIVHYPAKYLKWLRYSSNYEDAIEDGDMKRALQIGQNMTKFLEDFRKEYGY